MRSFYLIITVTFLSALVFSFKQNTTVNNDWVFDKVIGKTIYFKGDKKFNTELLDLKYIGQLHTKNKAPYLILAGRECYGPKYDNICDVNPGIYVHSPSDGPFNAISFKENYFYPGKGFGYDNRLEDETRMFYGSCSPIETVVFMSRDLAYNKYVYHIITLTIVNDKLNRVFKKVDSITYAKYKIPNCNEVPGILYKRK